MDHLSLLALRLHHPLEPDGMALGHVRTLDHDAVGVLQVLLERRCAAPTERDPQTGDRGGVSYAGLVLDLDGSESREQFLDQVVLFVVERGAAEMGERHRAVERLRRRPSCSQFSSLAFFTRSATMSIAGSSGIVPIRFA